MEVMIMSKAKNDGTKTKKIPKKVDNEEKQQDQEENKPKAIQWKELDKYIGKAVWDSREKEWRILVGYRRTKETFSITFTDIADWVSYYDRFLYLEEVR